MRTPILATLVITLGLTGCSSTSDSAAKPPAEEARAVRRVGNVDFHTDTAIVAFAVRNMAASKAWYQRVLGSSIVYEVPEQHWCEMTTPAERTLLGLHEQDAATAGSANALGFSVLDMAAARAHLVAQKVQLEGDVIEIPGIVKLLYFTDPDGNRMWFYAPPG